MGELGGKFAPARCIPGTCKRLCASEAALLFASETELLPEDGTGVADHDAASNLDEFVRIFAGISGTGADVSIQAEATWEEDESAGGSDERKGVGFEISGICVSWRTKFWESFFTSSVAVDQM
ncbi:hypothetical protein KSP40_PGU011546 [Platanthera guangdongensis]|uniref:Uncharacterized protein n=1 Tax=Platanthera guangdongensis TaxID=2320717 RepID=A0ABR2LIB6_9ASPA